MTKNQLFVAHSPNASAGAEAQSSPESSSVKVRAINAGELVISTQEAGFLVVPRSDYELLQQFAAEEGITDMSLAVGALLREYIKLMDMVWEEKLSRPIPTTSALDALMKQVEADEAAGLNEDMPPDLIRP